MTGGVHAMCSRDLLSLDLEVRTSPRGPQHHIIIMAQTAKPIRRLRPQRAASNCPLTIYPPRFIEQQLPVPDLGLGVQVVEICRFHNFDVERGCLRRSRSCCALDHDHCYNCGGRGHRAFECCANSTDASASTVPSNQATGLTSVVFPFNHHDDDDDTKASIRSNDPSMLLAKNDGDDDEEEEESSQSSYSLSSSPALLVLGGRLRGRTLAACEMLPLSHFSSAKSVTHAASAAVAVSASSSSSSAALRKKWSKLPNLREHRGSAAACSPIGSGIAFVLGGGTADGNSDAVEMLDFACRGASSGQKRRRLCQPHSDQKKNGLDQTGTVMVDHGKWRWQEMESRLSEPRHAFGATACVSHCRTNETTTDTTARPTSATLYAVGGWSHGTVSCGSVERLRFEYNGLDGGAISSPSVTSLSESKWEACAPLLLPRRLHSVVSSSDGSYIYVLGGFVDDRRTTSSIERYDVNADKWMEMEDVLPYVERGCPLVQAVSDCQDGFLIFPFGGGGSGSGKNKKETRMLKEDGRLLVLRYTPGSEHASSCASSSSASTSSFSSIAVPTSDDNEHGYLRLPIANWHSFSATTSISLRKAYLIGGTIEGKWTNRGYELDLQTFEWIELPPMAFARRRLATLVLE